jgi:hypothetical protein
MKNADLNNGKVPIEEVTNVVTESKTDITTQESTNAANIEPDIDQVRKNQTLLRLYAHTHTHTHTHNAVHIARYQRGIFTITVYM